MGLHLHLLVASKLATAVWSHSSATQQFHHMAYIWHYVFNLPPVLHV
jgi:hypothetical protein